jgi:hypothetical protein
VVQAGGVGEAPPVQGISTAEKSVLFMANFLEIKEMTMAVFSCVSFLLSASFCLLPSFLL